MNGQLLWFVGYGSENRVDKLIQPLVLKGRQAGMYIILAMQRPDAEYFPSGVRDNLTFRISVGRLSPIGYLMTFGEDFKNKPFTTKINLVVDMLFQDLMYL